ncbi:carboxypeptidase-like regulatory domain-containing protein [Saccharicrinis sp. FJH2]|uniref:TonB-dependent receptor n=1 Tax=Saccharicrinis sp. FJH65 TaxID=3344659 RepID=UPI0035F2DDFD
MRRLFLIIPLILLCLLPLNAQTRYVIFGKVTDSIGNPLELVSIQQKFTLRGTTTDSNGNYEISFPRKDSVTIIFSRLGSKTIEKVIHPTTDTYELNIVMSDAVTTMTEISVSDRKTQSATMQRIDSKYAENIPSASGNKVEELIMTLPGVFNNNELSSQYSVRGGNFDENLVYVNDIEIYRPLLIRSGQQEGLSFINSDMVSSISFSSGGFDAKYGDKMSSVLDIKYRKPTGNKASISASLLGASAFAEHATKNGRFTQMHGFRYKTSAYLLGTLDTKAEYNPSFLDYQTYMTYMLTNRIELSVLGNISKNRYEFRPQSRETKFGTYNIARSLMVYFDGWENDVFMAGTGAASLSYRVNDNNMVKLTGSYYSTVEDEANDILSEYWLNELDNQMGSENYGDSIENIGVGGALEHTRNHLNASVASVSLRGTHALLNHTLQWGATLQKEMITDKINEWEMRDSAGYSWPYSEQGVVLYNHYNTINSISSNRVNLYLQDSYNFVDIGLILTGGTRLSYWSFNNETLFSPRFSVLYTPKWKRDFAFKGATGIYYQAPFYKEIRSRTGEINTHIKSQKSVHYVLGMDYYFRKWERPFKLSVEAYYKNMSNLIPYDIKNVQIRYYGENLAVGYAAGLDFRIFGEFVPGVDSWISLSLLRTREDLLNDMQPLYEDGVQIGMGPVDYVPRPTDQAYNLSIFFQDYFPGNPNYKVHLKGVYAAPLPFGPPNGQKYQMTGRSSPYTRVDMGASRLIVGENQKNFLRHFKELWLGLDVFNMFDINNVNSYYWVPDNYGNVYAVPNYLTGRRFNFSITAKF